MSKQLKVSEAAAQLGVSRYTVYAWVARKKIRHTRYGRTVRIPEAEVRRLVRDGTVRVNGEARPEEGEQQLA